MKNRESGHPIIFLWCHPRSMSTAVERVMRARGDLSCDHEPFMYDYYGYRRVRTMPHFELEPHQVKSYRQIADAILAQAEDGPVFVKDMAYYIVPALFDDPDFARRIRHGFLIRNPAHAMASYAKLDAAFTRDEVGIEAQWHLFAWLRKELDIIAPVLEAEKIRQDPQFVMGQYWQALGLEMIPSAFHWDGNTTLPPDWEQVSGWHQNVGQSQGINAPEEDLARSKDQEFAIQCEKRPELHDHLNHHLPFYHQLKSHAI